MYRQAGFIGQELVRGSSVSPAHTSAHRSGSHPAASTVASALSHRWIHDLFHVLHHPLAALITTYLYRALTARLNPTGSTSQLVLKSLPCPHVCIGITHEATARMVVQVDSHPALR
jgi:hypothetical protein